MSAVTDNTILGLSHHDHDRCCVAVLEKAERHCRSAGLRLTPARKRTLEILLENHKAMGAYEVLERLSADGLGSKPPIAYRALSFLVENGFAHRIERLNAYIACHHPGESHDPAFMICTDCGAVGECVTAASRSPLSRQARDNGFRIDSTSVEATGQCSDCAEGS